MAYSQGEASPSELAVKLGRPLNAVAYHTQRLVEMACVELVRTERGPGIKHFYRATCAPPRGRRLAPAAARAAPVARRADARAARGGSAAARARTGRSTPTTCTSAACPSSSTRRRGRSSPRCSARWSRGRSSSAGRARAGAARAPSSARPCSASSTSRAGDQAQSPGSGRVGRSPPRGPSSRSARSACSSPATATRTRKRSTAARSRSGTSSAISSSSATSGRNASSARATMSAERRSSELRPSLGCGTRSTWPAASSRCVDRGGAGGGEAEQGSELGGRERSALREVGDGEHLAVADPRAGGRSPRGTAPRRARGGAAAAAWWRRTGARVSGPARTSRFLDFVER